MDSTGTVVEFYECGSEQWGSVTLGISWSIIMGRPMSFT